MIIIGILALDLYLFFILYVACMGMIRAHDEGKLNWLLWIMCLPFVVASVLLNVLHNVLLISLIYWELPREWTVSTRMKRYMQDKGYRGMIARWLCLTLLNPFDSGHCGD